MRLPRALLHAMRTRRTGIDLTQADRLAAGDPPGSDHPGLGDLLDAARAPAMAEELAGEKAAVKAFTTHRKRAARAARRRIRPSIRTTAVAGATGLALLLLSGTAVAARTGNLPAEAQQHAHRLFSALGVPAPRTGAPTPAPSSSSSTDRPGPAPSPAITALSWCDDWTANPRTSKNRSKLLDAAGSEDRIPGYCDRVRRAAPSTPAGTPRPTTPATPATPSGPPTAGLPGATPSATATPSPGPTDATATDTPPTPGAKKSAEHKSGHPTHPTHPPHPTAGLGNPDTP
jgi:hypothetical protein